MRFRTNTLRATEYVPHRIFRLPQSIWSPCWQVPLLYSGCPRSVKELAMHRQMCTSDVTALQFSSHKQILSTPSGRSRDENVSSCCCRLPVAQVTMKTDHVAAKSGVISLAGLWLTLAFVLNLAWEIAHVRLYAI